MTTTEPVSDTHSALLRMTDPNDPLAQWDNARAFIAECAPSDPDQFWHDWLHGDLTGWPEYINFVDTQG